LSSNSRIFTSTSCILSYIFLSRSCSLASCLNLSYCTCFIKSPTTVLSLFFCNSFSYSSRSTFSFKSFILSFNFNISLPSLISFSSFIKDIFSFYFSSLFIFSYLYILSSSNRAYSILNFSKYNSSNFLSFIFPLSFIFFTDSYSTFVIFSSCLFYDFS
jgi:hypothetical protein